MTAPPPCVMDRADEKAIVSWHAQRNWGRRKQGLQDAGSWDPHPGSLNTLTKRFSYEKVGCYHPTPPPRV